ncbi:universal stress [Micractinium conductrix]|uniref:Universal stress n=1 Tax=Micractinium conductrix TaxID=554055 RepID=A0A2P6V803_9CHLO|nr:universal stress [Micractinium conductrix]|eukprot:PSC70208.1 universal stress [Micractinium conductrix]
MGQSSSTSAAPASSERVVLAVDDSATAVDTVSWAAKTLLHRGQEVHLVQVLDGSLASQADVNSGEGGIMAGGKAEVDANTLSTSTAYLAKIRDTLLAEGGVKPANVKLVPLPSNTATSGDVGRTISDYAAEHQADAVVVGSRGLGAFRRRFLGLVGLGSVSDYVAHHAPCTVFIHRPAA